MSANISCPVCSSPSEFKCGKCVQVHYCSKEHQKAHWPLHKKDCFPFKMEKVGGKGRVLISTRAFLPGQVIFKEKPIVMMPYVKSEDGYIGNTCVSCCKVLEYVKDCSNCGWPVCGRACEINPLHSGRECQILAGRNVSPYYRGSYLLLQVLRCLLLKDSQPEKYAKILELQDNVADLEKIENLTMIFDYVIARFRSLGFLEYSMDEIVRILGILNTNLLSQWTDVREIKNRRTAAHLFEKVSLASHSCYPNATPKIEKSGVLSLLAIREIQAGDEISITYCQFLDGTAKRWANLSPYCFKCHCPRCLSPTEFGTYFSSLKCTDCTSGYICPFVHEIKDEITWRCQGCSGVKGQKEIDEILTPLMEQAQKVIGTKDYSMNSVKRYDAVIARCEEVLHRNHYLLFALFFDLMEWMHNAVNWKNECILRHQKSILMNRIVQTGEQLLALLDKIAPGPQLVRGRIFFFMTNGLSEKCAIAIHKYKSHERPSTSNESSSEAIDKFFQVSKKAIEILSLEPKGTDDETCVKTLTDQLERISKHLGK